MILYIITGATGFIGKNLTNYLQRVGDNVVLEVSRKKERGSQTIVYRDLTVDILNSSKSFIHLAGKAHDLENTTDVQEYFEVNTQLTKELFDKFLKSNCETFVFVSSIKAVADSTKGVLTEDIVPNPKTPYGRSKLEAEDYILSQEMPSNKRVYVLRPCMVHGSGNKGNLNLLYRFVNKGIPYPFGAYKNQRSFLSIDNLCYIIKELVENKSIPNGVYHLADDKPLSTINLVKLIAKAINKQAKIVSIPKYIIAFFAKLGDFIPLPINSEKVKKLTEDYVVSNKKIKRALKIDFLPFSVEDGLLKTIKSFNKKD